MDSLLHYIGVPSWPANCDSEAYVDTFYEKFKQCGIAAGLTFQPA